MTDRFRRCLEAGSVVALFPLLKDWPEGELRELMADAEREYADTSARLSEAYRKLAFDPATFFSRVNSVALDCEVEQADMDVFAMCSEICSVALFYLGDVPQEAA